VKRLIVNADDLGRTRGINGGIRAAHERGLVTSATLMVAYPAAQDVAAMAGACPGLGIGLHVALTGGPPVSSPGQIPSLVDAQGRLPAKPEGLQGARGVEVLREARAQLARFVALLGRQPTHFDSHHHSHRLPVVRDALVALAREAGRPVRLASPDMGELLARAGVATTDRFEEGFFGDTANVEALLAILEALPEGTTELMCHPAEVDAELRGSSGYAEPRSAELQALTDPRVREACRGLGIQLIHFGQL
jgi:predicted glycoside hydrolase/deacetylase ChbG (UPF0249 family)